MPLSGGDRRRYVRELKRVEGQLAELHDRISSAFANVWIKEPADRISHT